MNESDHFDLLPFIAVLLCALGCLLLVTLSMSAISVGLHLKEAWIAPIAPPVPAVSVEGIHATEASTGSATKKPVLIEWDGTQATVHTGSSHTVLVPWTDNGKGKAFKDLVARFKAQRDTQYALFAVRPSGFVNFEDMADQFRKQKIGVGYEPLAQALPVKLVLRKAGNATPSP